MRDAIGWIGVVALGWFVTLLAISWTMGFALGVTVRSVAACEDAE